MNIKFKSLAIIAAISLIISCNDSTSTTDKKDIETRTAQTDTTAYDPAKNNSSNEGTDLMGAMNASMDRMQSMKMSGDFDMDFANMMIEHHLGAIDMSRIEVAQGTDEKMKAMAQKIITKQTAEVDQLKGLISKYKPHGMKHGEGELMKSMADMKQKMSASMQGNIDRDFASMMITHHEAGVKMSELQMEHGMDNDLKNMAKKGKADQTKEINELKTWLTEKK